VINKSVMLSLVATMALLADSVELDTIVVETTGLSDIVKDVSGEEIKSADLGEALAQQSASVSLIRRSGIANDVRVRGQKKDNINVTIDGAKVHGACPNRMDPPISHILTNNVDYIQINEGPFNVEDFGVLSADVAVHTLKPSKEFQGELNVGVGSFGYYKGAFAMSGGVENVRFLLSASSEEGGQYEDGNGNNFVGQIADNITKGLVSPMAQYQPQYQDMDAFKKETLMAKLFWDISDNQELRLSYTANRSDNVLYPSSKMDALYDDSDIYNMEYRAKDLGAYSKELYLQAYHSSVDHPMSTKYRIMGAENYMTHALTTEVDGAKIKNSFDIENHTITMGLDYSLRNWDGGYYKNGNPLPPAKFHSIWDVDTKNMALFIKDRVSMDKLTLDMGLRFDDTAITSANPTQRDNDYSELNGYLLGTYKVSEQREYFVGFGRSSRVPDAKELYWLGSMGNSIGTDTLNPTINYELDMGMEMKFENGLLKGKIFYSQLEDYIAYNATNLNAMGGAYHAYENVDATLYGFDLSGSYMVTDSIFFDYGVAYQRGEKDRPLTGQTGTNLPDIAPLKANLAMNYAYDSTLDLRAEAIIAEGWDDIDAENGEQQLDGYGVVNLKATKRFAQGFELSVGVDNLFDEAYAISNTYKDLVLLTLPESEVMLMNEPGRYFYANLKYKF
jgi:iron complex outermembrane receptor protein